MNKLAILSRDYNLYKELIESAGLQNIVIIAATDDIDKIEDLAGIDILLAEPDLGAQIAMQCVNLQWLQSTWAGVKPLIDLPSAGFILTGVKDVFGKQMREYVFTYLLHFSRKVSQFQDLQKQQKWLGTDVKPGSLYGKTLGIIGVGSMGKEVAKLAKQFEMQVLGVTRSTGNCEFVDNYYHYNELELFATQLDYCVCLLPHTDITNSILGAKFFAKLPSHAVFINAGRGQVVDHSALISALQKDQLAGAVLDVYPEEPISKNSPFWTTKNLIVTQHTSAISAPADIVSIFVQNYRHFRTQTSLKYTVDYNKGY